MDQCQLVSLQARARGATTIEIETHMVMLEGLKRKD